MAEQLARFEVPRVSVDFQSDDLTGRQKLTLLKYMALDDEIAGIGSQRFSEKIRDNIPLQPVREWVTQNWEGQFVYDFSRRNVPITFRTSLALALFTTRITEYLDKVEAVEVYGSRSVQQIFEKQGIPGPVGLETVDFPKLPNEVRSELVTPLIDQMYQAKAVAEAGLLFPNGLDLQALLMTDPAIIFSLLGTGDDTIRFNGIDDLDQQATAAKVALGNYLKLKSMTSLVKKARKVVKKERTEEDMKRMRKKLDNTKDPEPKDVHYDPGTSFLRVFPYKEGERAEDVLRAFRRMTGNSYYSGHVEERHRGEYLRVRIAEDGRLIGLYGWNEFGWGNSEEQREVDMLSDRFDYTEVEHNRRKTIWSLVDNLRNEMDTNKKVITEARAKYGQTSFTVEKGLIEALTFRGYTEATPKQLEEDKRLVDEAKRNVGIFEDMKGEGDSTDLVVLSDKPVNNETLELDSAILRAIKERYHLSFSDMVSIMMGKAFRKDNIGDWFEGSSELLFKFNSVLVGTTELFSILGIGPTKDETALRQAYRAIARTTHPDITSSLSPEKQFYATQKFVEATRAYKNLVARIAQHDIDSLAPTYYLGRISQLFVPGE